MKSKKPTKIFFSLVVGFKSSDVLLFLLNLKFNANTNDELEQFWQSANMSLLNYNK